MNSKSILILSGAFAAMVVFADPDAPQVTLGVVTQDPATHLVKATYTLDESAVITFDVKTNGVSIGGANLTHAYGDVHRVVAAGEHTLYWQADNAWPGYRPQSATFEVVAWATNSPPDYMVIDLVATKGARTYYTAPEQLPGEGGVANKMYKTDYLVMRRIPAKDAIFPMGLLWTDNQSCLYHRVKLTNDFYMAVYELTLGQMTNAINVAPASLTTYYNYIGGQSVDNAAQFTAYAKNLANPLPETPYFKFRGFSGSLWGENRNHIITDTGSYLYKLRNALNLPTLDLPTDAEWEFACRAGTSAQCYDGTKYPDSPTNIAWMAYNSTYTYLWGYNYYLPHEVGLLPPNAFGLYDMIGNVKEFCLDLYNEGAAYAARNDNVNGVPVIAPTGPETDIKGNRDGCARGSYDSYTQGGLWAEWYADPASTRRVTRGGCASDVNWSGASAYQRTPVGSCRMPPYGSDQAADKNGVATEHDTRGPAGYRLVCLP